MERLLPDGDSRLEFLAGYVGAGASFRPLPSTRPPPSFRADIFHGELEPHEIEFYVGPSFKHMSLTEKMRAW